jgi:hypothetical protein
MDPVPDCQAIGHQGDLPVITGLVPVIPIGKARRFS